MRKGTELWVLLFSTVSTFSVYAVNPASTQYVDEKFNQLQSKIGQHFVGQHDLGGVVYYVYLDSTGTQHGLVAATEDESGGPIYTWGLSSTLGTAQYQCANKVTGGYTNWVVPNQAQMTALYTNRFAINPTDVNGGFSNKTLPDAAVYWASNNQPGSITNAFSMDFATGSFNTRATPTPLNVRCIRGF
jgi:hypothetical protein